MSQAELVGTTSAKHRIYVASSWRNDQQPEVVRLLRLDGHEVYDFKGLGDGWGESGDGPGGFGWAEIDPQWKDRVTDIPTYLKALNHPRAEEGFRRDMDALMRSDVCVMVMPCGPSASMEMGWAAGSNRIVIVYIPGMREPDLMVKMADLITDNLDTVRNVIDAYTRPKATPIEIEIALWYIANCGSANLFTRIRRAHSEMLELLELCVDEDDTPDTPDTPDMLELVSHLAEEMADVAICLVIAANKLGVSLSAEVAKKVAINHQRKWKVNDDGTLSHVKGSDPREGNDV